MAPTKTPAFAPRGSKAEIEAGLAFTPKFDADGLIPAIVTDARERRSADVRVHECRGARPHHRNGHRAFLVALPRRTLEEGR